MKVTLIPREDRVLIEQAKGEEKSAGGIIIPSIAQDKPLEGIVVRVGPGRHTDAGQLIPTTLKVGDRVMFGKYTGSYIDIGDDSFLIMRESEVIATIEVKE